MKRLVIGVTGISGVGKSTLIKKVSATMPLQHLQASAMIQDGRNAAEGACTQDELRYANIDENQRFLVVGFRRNVGAGLGLTILDGHTIVEKGDDLIGISPDVFEAIHVSRLIFLADDPKAIAERRRNDAGRKRPLRSAEQIQYIQDFARQQAVTICQSLGVELHLHSPAEVTSVAALLQRATLSGS